MIQLYAVFVEKAEEMRSQISTLESFMHIASDPEDNLRMIELKKTPNSCEWLTGLDSFTSWRDFEHQDMLCYWLSGQAGSGKSILTTHVVRHLQTLGVDTCYYFFRHGQKAGAHTCTSGCATRAYIISHIRIYN
jgi:hypothetical protein